MLRLRAFQLGATTAHRHYALRACSASPITTTMAAAANAHVTHPCSSSNNNGSRSSSSTISDSVITQNTATAVGTDNTNTATKNNSEASTSTSTISTPLFIEPVSPATAAATTKLAADLLSRGTNQPKLTFLLGGPGVGKGTLAKTLCDRARTDELRTGDVMEHISVGVLLRQAISSSGENILGIGEDRAAMAAIMSRGGVIPSPISTYHLLHHLCQHSFPSSTTKHWVVDGFPRSFANAMYFESLGLKPTVVVALDAPEDVLRARLAQRGRRDDVENIVENRLVQYRNEWESIKEFYRRRNVLVCVDADGGADTVFQRCVTALRQFESNPMIVTTESMDKYEQHNSHVSASTTTAKATTTTGAAGNK